MNGGIIIDDNIYITVKISFFELEDLFKCHNYSDDEATVIADYLTECCCDYVKDLRYYIYNTLPSYAVILNSKEECLQYIDEQLSCGVDDCTIYKACNDLYYLEWC